MSEDRLSWEELRWRLDALRRGALPESGIYSTVHEFGRRRFLDARPDVERLLARDNPELRYVALEVLITDWNLAEHWETARDFLNHDPDGNVRCLAASSLGYLKRNTGDHHTLAALALVVRDEQEEQSVRLSAYMAMKRVIHDDRREQWEMLTHQARTWREIDWKIIDSYRL